MTGKGISFSALSSSSAIGRISRSTNSRTLRRISSCCSLSSMDILFSDQNPALVLEHQLLLLVVAARPDVNDAAVGFRFALAFAHDLALAVERVARIHRLEKTHLPVAEVSDGLLGQIL